MKSDQEVAGNARLGAVAPNTATTDHGVPGGRHRKTYVPPQITDSEPLTNVTLFSAGTTPSSSSPPFIPPD